MEILFIVTQNPYLYIEYIRSGIGFSKEVHDERKARRVVLCGFIPRSG